MLATVAAKLLHRRVDTICLTETFSAVVNEFISADTVGSLRTFLIGEMARSIANRRLLP